MRMAAPRLIFLADPRNRESQAIERLAKTQGYAATIVRNVNDLAGQLNYDAIDAMHAASAAHNAGAWSHMDFLESPLHGVPPELLPKPVDRTEPTLVIAPFFTKFDGTFSWLTRAKPTEVATLDVIGDLMASNPNARVVFVSDTMGDHLDEHDRSFKLEAHSAATILEELHHPVPYVPGVKGSASVVAIPVADLDKHLSWFNGLVRGALS